MNRDAWMGLMHLCREAKGHPEVDTLEAAGVETLGLTGSASMPTELTT
jgi:hypothetical protein